MGITSRPSPLRTLPEQYVARASDAEDEAAMWNQPRREVPHPNAPKRDHDGAVSGSCSLTPLSSTLLKAGHGLTHELQIRMSRIFHV